VLIPEKVGSTDLSLIRENSPRKSPPKSPSPNSSSNNRTRESLTEKKINFKKSDTSKTGLTKKASLKRQNKRRSITTLSSSASEKYDSKQVQFPLSDKAAETTKITKKSNNSLEKRSRSHSQAEQPIKIIDNSPTKHMDGSPLLGSSGLTSSRGNLSAVKRKKSATSIAKGVTLAHRLHSHEIKKPKNYDKIDLPLT